MIKIITGMLLVIALSAMALSVALAHEDEEEGDYNFVVGFLHEPAYEGEMNAVSVRVTKVVAEADAAHSGGGHAEMTRHETRESEKRIEVGIIADVDKGGGVNVYLTTLGWKWTPENIDQDHVPGEGHAHIHVDGEKLGRVYGPYYHLSGLEPGERHIRVTLNSNDHSDLTYDGRPVEASVTVDVEAKHGTGMESGGHHEAEDAPVEGLEATLQVEVTHVPSEVSRTMNLRPVHGDPGHYVADLIPTSPGHYRFRFLGAVEGNPVDKTFDSMAGGGGFDDAQAASVIHFPEAVASAREVEGAVRGAQATAERARAEAMSAKSDVSGASTMGIIGIIVGVVGVALGGAAMFVSLRRGN